MKKTVWTFGLTSGAIISILMLLTIPFQDELGFDHSLLVGYTTMVLAFLLIYFGVRSYRDNVSGGSPAGGQKREPTLPVVISVYGTSRRTA